MNLENFLKLATGTAVDRRSLMRIAARVLGLPEASVLARQNEPIPAELEKRMVDDFQALLAGKPEAYVLGDIPFLDWDFLIDARALIPRPETEDLCGRVIAGYAGRPAPARILDLCCGSGVMGLSMALAFPESRVWLTDISREALGLCEANIGLHGLEDRVAAVWGNLWDAVPGHDKFHLVLANPPYVAAADEVGDSVLSHEPHLALYSDDHGMAHIKLILDQLPDRLFPGGRAAFELGHEHSELLEPWLAGRDDYQNFRWEKDLFGVSRFLFYDVPIARFGQSG